MLIYTYINQSKLHYALEDSNIQVNSNINMITRRLKLKTAKQFDKLELSYWIYCPATELRMLYNEKY